MIILEYKKNKYYDIDKDGIDYRITIEKLVVEKIDSHLYRGGNEYEIEDYQFSVQLYYDYLHDIDFDLESDIIVEFQKRFYERIINDHLGRG